MPCVYLGAHLTRVISTVLFALVVFLVYGSKDFKGLDEPRNAVMTVLWKVDRYGNGQIQMSLQIVVTVFT